MALELSKLIKLTYLNLELAKILFIFNIKIFINNKIGDILIKYLGLGLSKLIYLNQLTLWLKFCLFENKIGDIGAILLT